MAQSLLRAAEARDETKVQRRRRLVQSQYSFPNYVSHLLATAIPALPRVSVVVPNFNYARYMAERLGSIFRQTHPVHEIIVLDDCSTDNSLDVIRAISDDWGREVKVVANDTNSGSVFRQWTKGAEARNWRLDLDRRGR
jgi:cellulose synthase/poly-beta-1,6-N-acetylglucosamine synthase-like glycosyltransferase